MEQSPSRHSKSVEKQEKKPLIYWLFFWISGFAPLFVWNCILSLTHYLQHRYDYRAESYYPFFINIGQFSTFFVYHQIMGKVRFQTVMIRAPIMLVILSITIFAVGELYKPDEQNNTFKFCILLGIMPMIGFLTAILEASIISYVLTFSYLEISYYSSSTAVVGMITASIALMNTFVLNSDDYFLNGFFYLIFQLVTLAVILLTFSAYIKRYLNTDQNKVLPKPNENKLQEASSEAAPYQSVSADDPPLLETLKYIYPYLVNMVLVYAITLGLFPALSLNLGLGWSNKDGSNQVVILAFNVGDFIGKILYSKFTLKEGLTPYIISLARISFAIYVILIFGFQEIQGVLDNWYATVLFVMACAITNGYITSAFFSLSSERVPKNHQKNAGFLVTLCLLFGLTYGSFTVVLGTKKSSDD